MRQTIKKRKDRNRREKLMGFLAFFVFAPLISILLGLGLVKYLILPYFQGNEEAKNLNQQEVMKNEGDLATSDNFETTEKDEEEATETEEESKYTEQFRKSGKGLFNVQVGSFDDAENAMALVDEMQSKGLAGYLVKNETFKVFAGSFYNREEADSLIGNIKSYYSDAFISSIVVGQGIIRYNLEEKAAVDSLSELLALIDDFYGQETSLWATAIEKNDVSFVKQITIDNTSIIKSKLEELEGDYLSEDIRHVITQLNKLVQDRESLINLMDGKQNIADTYSKFNTSLFNYLTMI